MMKTKKIILTILILSMIALVFTGCDGNPVVPPTNICDSVDKELSKIIEELDLSDDLRFYYYTHFYSGCYDLKEALDKEIDPQGIPGLTYRTFILNALYEEELVNKSYPACVVDASDSFLKLADNLSNWKENFAIQITELAILGAAQALGMPALGIGISSLILATYLVQIGVKIAELEEAFYNQALCLYLFNRSQVGGSHETAWGEGIPLGWSTGKKLATENFFKHLWDKYGDAITNNNLNSFKEEQHEMLRELILQALSQPPIASLTPEEIELIRKWGYGGDYVVRWPNGYVDVYDATNYSQMQEVLNQWNSAIGGPVVFRLSSNPNSPVKVIFDSSLELENSCGHANDVVWGDDCAFSEEVIKINPSESCCGDPNTKYYAYLVLFNAVVGFNYWAEVDPTPFDVWSNFSTIPDTIKTMVHALYKVPPGYYLGDSKQRKDHSNVIIKNISTSEGVNCLDNGKK